MLLPGSYFKDTHLYRVLALYGKPDAVAVVQDWPSLVQSSHKLLLIYRELGVIVSMDAYDIDDMVIVTPFSVCQRITYINTNAFDEAVLNYINHVRPSAPLTLEETEQPWRGYGLYPMLNEVYPLPL